MPTFQEIKEQIKREFEKINLKRFIMRMFLLLAIAAGFFGGCSYINRQVGLENDNFIEEAIEDYIEKETGLDLDLTPFD